MLLTMSDEHDGERQSDSPPQRRIRKRPLFLGAFSMDDGDEENRAGKPRQWLYDRSNGTSRYGSSRPPHPMFYVPFPIKWWPDILEQNCLCEQLGKIGPVERTGMRAFLLRVGLVANVVSFCLGLFACVAISKQFELIRASSYSYASVTVPDTPEFPEIFIDVGLRAVALENVLTVGKEVVDFDQFCGLSGEGFFLYLEPEHCAWCQSVSFQMIFTLTLSLLGYIPTILTDVLRQFENYDVNCQKVFASFFSLISLGLALRTWLLYQTGCLDGFHDGNVEINFNGTDYGLPSALGGTVLVNYQWSKGPGLFALQASGLLKIVDIIVNLLIPTPSITRDHEEQQRYEELYGPDQVRSEDEPSPSANEGDSEDCEERSTP